MAKSTLHQHLWDYLRVNNILLLVNFRWRILVCNNVSCIDLQVRLSQMKKWKNVCMSYNVLITKASLNSLAKHWWSIVQEQLWPTENDNTLSPSLVSLVARLMAGYVLNVVEIISNDIQDMVLNKWAGLSFPCLITKLCFQANIPPNKFVDK